MAWQHRSRCIKVFEIVFRTRFQQQTLLTPDDKFPRRCKAEAVCEVQLWKLIKVCKCHFVSGDCSPVCSTACYKWCTVCFCQNLSNTAPSSDSLGHVDSQDSHMSVSCSLHFIKALTGSANPPSGVFMRQHWARCIKSLTAELPAWTLCWIMQHLGEADEQWLGSRDPNSQQAETDCSTITFKSEFPGIPLDLPFSLNVKNDDVPTMMFFFAGPD